MALAIRRGGRREALLRAHGGRWAMQGRPRAPIRGRVGEWRKGRLSAKAADRIHVCIWPLQVATRPFGKRALLDTLSSRKMPADLPKGR